MPLASSEKLDREASQVCDERCFLRVAIGFGSLAVWCFFSLTTF